MSTLLHLLKVEIFVPLFSPCSSVPLSLNSRLIIHCLCFNGTDGGRELAGSAVVVALGRASGRKLAGGAVIVIAQGGTDGGREFAGSAVVALGRASGRELASGSSLSSHKVAPMVAENLPAAQSSHSAEPAAENLPAVQSISSIGWVFFGAGAFFCLGLTCFEPASAGAAGFGGMAKQLGARRNLFMKGNLQTKGPRTAKEKNQSVCPMGTKKTSPLEKTSPLVLWPLIGREEPI